MCQDYNLEIVRIDKSQTLNFKGTVLLHVGGNNVCDGQSEK